MTVEGDMRVRTTSGRRRSRLCATSFENSATRCGDVSWPPAQPCCAPVPQSSRREFAPLPHGRPVRPREHRDQRRPLCPVSRASITAPESISPPRAVLMRRTPSRHSASVSRLIICRVIGLRGTCKVIHMRLAHQLLEGDVMKIEQLSSKTDAAVRRTQSRACQSRLRCG